MSELNKDTIALRADPASTAPAKRGVRELQNHPVPWLVVAPLASVLAACLLIWVALRAGPEEPVGYSFEVLHAKDSAGLNPIARRVAEALSAGASNAVREVKDGS